MNKKELIEKINNLSYTLTWNTPRINREIVIDLIEQLDEPQKVVVPQFVADWIERSKQEKRNIRNALNNGGEKMRLWFLDLENQELFARAWLDGYTVEEKRFLVRMKGVTNQTRTLKRNIDVETWYFGNPTNYEDVNAHHTREELESNGFGWVFDCEGVEVEEVK